MAPWTKHCQGKEAIPKGLVQAHSSSETWGSLLECRSWSGCGFIPEDLHPKSFRGSFGHNTNVWAVRDRAGMPLGGPTGVFSLDQDLHEWFSQGVTGMGGRVCKDLQPNVQVRLLHWTVVAWVWCVHRHMMSN